MIRFLFFDFELIFNNNFSLIYLFSNLKAKKRYIFVFLANHKQFNTLITLITELQKFLLYRFRGKSSYLKIIPKYQFIFASMKFFVILIFFINKIKLS
jgi:hypothetical protein